MYWLWIIRNKWSTHLILPYCATMSFSLWILNFRLWHNSCCFVPNLYFLWGCRQIVISTVAVARITVIIICISWKRRVYYWWDKSTLGDGVCLRAATWNWLKFNEGLLKITERCRRQRWDSAAWHSRRISCWWCCILQREVGKCWQMTSTYRHLLFTYLVFILLSGYVNIIHITNYEKI